MVKYKRGEKMAKKRKLNYARLAIVLVAFLIIVFALFQLFRGLLPNKYAAYRNVEKSNKLADETEIVNEINEGDMAFSSINYPMFENETLNEEIKKIVAEFKKEPIDDTKEEIHFLDYQSNMIGEQYISVHFTYQILDKEEVVIKSNHKTLNFDLTENKVMSLKDILRIDYLDQLQKEAKKQLNVDLEATAENFEAFILEETGIRFYMSDFTESFLFNYQDNIRYLKLDNALIPTLAPENVVKQPKRKLDPNKPMIAFTFDDGPNPGLTEKIVDLFDQYQGRATFFQVGSRIEQYPETTRYVYEHGSEIGNHSYSHQSLATDDVEAIKQQVYDTQDIVFKLLGYEIATLRPTFGAISETLEKTIDMPMIIWTIDSLDWQSRKMTNIVSEVEPRVKDGSIILMHDLYETTYDAVAYLLPILSERGYQFVTISEYLEFSNQE